MKGSVLILMVFVLVLPTAAHAAPSGDMTYCAELSALYRKYIQNAPGHGRFDTEAAVALEDCQKGNTAAGIPVLEKKLRQDGFSLPKEFKP